MRVGRIITFGAGGLVRRSDLPADSLIAPRFPGADLADAYAVSLAPGEHQIDALADETLSRPGIIFRTAMKLRDTAVSAFGVKTSKQVREWLVQDGADHIDFFPVLSRSPSEIVLGGDDRHLDFRLSLLLRQLPDRRRSELIATTVVNCHGRFGRAYLATIMIGHVAVVRSALAKAAAFSQSNSDGGV